MRLAVVGVCASGKTTLVKSLRELGIEAYNVAQEHSCIKKLWQKKKPDIVVLLDAGMDAIRGRRVVPWAEERLAVQLERLHDALENADLYIQTDNLSKTEVVDKVVEYIRRIEHEQNHTQ